MKSGQSIISTRLGADSALIHRKLLFSYGEGLTRGLLGVSINIIVSYFNTIFL
jgi:hypothetical protein